MKYFLTMGYGGELKPMDSHIIYLQKGDKVICNNKSFYVDWKMFDVDRNHFIIGVVLE